MAQYVTPAQLSGLFKEAYADDVMNLVPEVAKVVKMIPFVPRDKETGNLYHQPVILSQEHGVSYAGPSDGAFALEEAVAMTMQDAQIQGSQMLLRSAMSYDAAAKASNSKKAFVKATELVVENMLESVTKRLEISCIYGGSGLGTVPANSHTEDDATHIYLTLSEASWATGIWSGLENAKLQMYDESGDLISSGTDSVFTVDRVDVDTRTIRVLGTATGITALETANDSEAVTPYFKGSYGKEMAGLDQIISNDGELFNIDAEDYNLWAGNNITVSGQLTMGKVLKAVSKAVARGLNEDVVCLVNPDTWANLASDLSALRMYDGSYKKEKAENGFESIVYHGQNGKIEVISHNIIKAGEAFIFPPKKVKRIGAQELSFKTPGREDEIFLHLPNNAGFELRVYCDQAIFVETPARCVKISGFTNA